MNSIAHEPTSPVIPIVFAPANSFPAGTYRVMLDSLRSRGYAVSAVDKFGHDPKYPVTDNWPHLVDQLADVAVRQRGKHNGQNPILVGHSLGGILSLMCAARHPELVRAVVMLDSPVLGGWRAWAVRILKHLGFMHRISPSQVSRRRRYQWDDREAVFEYFRDRKVFSSWNEQVLRDFVDHGTQDVDGVRQLVFDRNIESSIYDTLPDTVDRMLRQQPLRCPLAFIGGLQSTEIKQIGGLRITSRFASGRVTMLDGSHLFPMEKPLATAAAIETSVRAILGA